MCVGSNGPHPLEPKSYATKAVRRWNLTCCTSLFKKHRYWFQRTPPLEPKPCVFVPTDPSAGIKKFRPQNGLGVESYMVHIMFFLKNIDVGYNGPLRWNQNHVFWFQPTPPMEPKSSAPKDVRGVESNMFHIIFQKTSILVPTDPSVGTKKVPPPKLFGGGS